MDLWKYDNLKLDDDRMNPVIPRPGFVDAFCDNCKRRTEQINGRCRWCEKKPNHNKTIELNKAGAIKNFRPNIRKAFYDNCPKCGNKKVVHNPTCSRCKSGITFPNVEGLDYMQREKLIIEHKIKIAYRNIERWKQDIERMNQKQY